MTNSSAIILVATVLIFSLHITLANPDSPDNEVQFFGCSHTALASISYQNNVELLLSDFTSHSTPTGYYSTHLGQSPDTVCGYYLCRGDITQKTCQKCLLDATQYVNDQLKCGYQDGTFYSEKCMFRYSNHSMYGEWEPNNSAIIPSAYGEKVSNSQLFNQTLSATLEALIDDTAFGSNINMGFATKEASVIGDEKIYSLAQCTLDIVGVNCSRCLRLALGNYLWSSREVLQGGEVKMPKCRLVYYDRPFYDANKGKNLGPPSVTVIYFLLCLFAYYACL